jgi:hypothetical protein
MSLPARCRSAGLAVTLVLALIGAPASSAWRNACDLCPPSCPMHQHRDDAAAEAAPRMKCHGAPAGSALHETQEEQRRGANGRGPSVARPPCGNHGAVSATVLPPMILPSAAPRLIVAGAERAPLSSTATHRRLADPPDTPPPILAA